MNPAAHLGNVATSWRARGNFTDFVRRLIWNYSPMLPARLTQREYCIHFRYPQPVGSIRLLVRNNMGADNFIHSEVFEHEYYRFPMRANVKTILDLGANAGFTAVYLGRLYPDAEIACVEPMPENLRVLEENLKLNGISATIFRVAVDTRDATLLMEVAPRDFAHKVASADSKRELVLQVNSLSVATIVRELGWQRIDLLKMDIEGHEQYLMQDPDWLDLVETVCVEWHSDSAERELGALASRFGFRAPLCRSGLWVMSRAPEMM